MIVVDTNTLAYLYLSSDKSAQAERLLTLEPKWIAPRLWKSEFRNVLALYLRKAILSIEDVLLILRQAESLMLGNEHDVSSVPVMQLVQSSACSAYDCEFVALAKMLGIPLITADKKVIGAFPGIACTIDDFLSKPR
ncbi:type II toxin-antitoxin system VapC family toxin [Candidatus Methylomicrobium oryzae]|uniref:type II toxin-antitoxin system VapC family toxin n=1 Tax=Candidatus Methylomicrobium oryzae TaxID=2802053 RepID=UPI001920B90F|nr:type II toxin-antitoxin system VapC family toxin [Methylomicrobium sp. RS1]MBL1263392.1 type II toxin-antitoxin system VapC family toxin [Methylomicrobium sp. RS1]